MTSLRDNSNKIVLEILDKYIGKSERELVRISLRSFASRVGISASSLSEIRRGLARPSRKVISKLVTSGVLSEKDCNTLRVLFGTEAGTNPPALAFQKQLSTEEFRELGSWYAPVMIELIKYYSPNGISATDISRRIDIGVEQIQESLNKIEKMGLISKNSKDLYHSQEINITTSDDIPCEVIRGAQKNILAKAIDCIDKVDTSARDNLSLFVSVSPERLAEIKNLLRDFLFQINAMGSSAGKPSEVYSLSIALFPLTQALKGEAHGIS
jgi:transcriptional regulator with XRE-family HTH domain